MFIPSAPVGQAATVSALGLGVGVGLKEGDEPQATVFPKGKGKAGREHGVFIVVQPVPGSQQCGWITRSWNSWGVVAPCGVGVV